MNTTQIVNTIIELALLFSTSLRLLFLVVLYQVINVKAQLPWIVAWIYIHDLLLVDLVIHSYLSSIHWQRLAHYLICIVVCLVDLQLQVSLLFDLPGRTLWREAINKVMKNIDVLVVRQSKSTAN